jgi:hypothetical protein
MIALSLSLDRRAALSRPAPGALHSALGAPFSPPRREAPRDAREARGDEVSGGPGSAHDSPFAPRPRPARLSLFYGFTVPKAKYTTYETYEPNNMRNNKQSHSTRYTHVHTLSHMCMCM